MAKGVRFAIGVQFIIRVINTDNVARSKRRMVRIDTRLACLTTSNVGVVKIGHGIPVP